MVIQALAEKECSGADTQDISGMAGKRCYPVQKGREFMNSDIPSSEIKQDILDTEREIWQMEKEEAGYRLIGDRVSMYKADARRNGIRERQVFIEKLQELLVDRGEVL